MSSTERGNVEEMRGRLSEQTEENGGKISGPEEASGGQADCVSWSLI